MFRILADRGVHTLSENHATWCPDEGEFGTKQLNRLIWLNGLKKWKDSCIQWIAVSH